MMKGKKVVTNSFIFIVTRLILKAFNFFLIPLYTSYLSTTDYGMTNIASSFTSTVIILISLNLSFAVSRYYAEYSGDSVKIKKLFGTIINISVLLSIVFCILAFILNKSILNVFFIGFNFVPSYCIIIVSIPMQCVYSLYLDILCGMQDAKRSGIISILYCFINLLFTLYFLVNHRYGADGVFLSVAISYSIGAIWAFIDLYKRDLYVVCIDKTILKKILSYSIPIIPHSFSSSITQLLSKLFIGNVGTLSMVGLFGLAGHFGAIAETIQGGVSSAYQPWLYKELKEQKVGWKEQIKNIIPLLLWILGLLFIILSLFSQEAILLMASASYSSAWMIVPLIVIIYTIKTPYYFYVAVLFFYKKSSRYVFIISIISNIINIFFSYFFIMYWGMFGSVFADGIAMIVLISLVYRLSRNYEDINIRITLFIKYMLLVSGFIIIGILPSYTFFQHDLSFVNIIYKIGMILIYCSIAIITEKKYFHVL